MCGIVAYIGKKQAFPIVLKGLKRLEYRGYDSAGIAYLQGDHIEVTKRAGKLSELGKALFETPKIAQLAIAHSRWATHGGPTNENAHPHYDQFERVAIIHNGIIENYEPLKKELLKRGYTFTSDTDTEVLVNLIEDVQKKDNLKQFSML